jgi:4-hydroxy-tetrahydrodipicolinate reductase
VWLTHPAGNRDGFAAGALLAAQWVIGRKGCFEFGSVLDEILGDIDDNG